MEVEEITLDHLGAQGAQTIGALIDLMDERSNPNSGRE
jgi:hypothetical protein